jgi:hypothetical protein
MDKAARHALATIRRCIEADRFRLTAHFSRRMDQRGLVWPDVLAALDAPTAVEDNGCDDAGRPRWIVHGPCADAPWGSIGVVCTIGRDDTGAVTVFITLFWED